MQIVCPHCTTSYAVNPANFGGGGRKVRCARCHEVWLAQPENVPAMAGGGADDGYFRASEQQADTRKWHAGEPPHIESPSISADWPETQRNAASESHWPQSSDHDDAADQSEPTSKSRFRSLGTPIKPFRLPSAWLTALPAFNLNSACVLMGAMVFGLTIWRADVVRLMPQTATFYKMVGLGVNLRGLAFEEVKITTETVNDKAVLLIEGSIVDVARKPVEIPRLRFIVRDAQGADLYAWNAVLEQPVLNPGEKAWFKTRLAAPPAEGREIAVRFFNKLDIAAGGT